jgi:CheY-like chemotaxis protein
MGGTLSVESALGEGSTFTLRVPVRVLDAAEVSAVEAAHALTAQAAAAHELERRPAHHEGDDAAAAATAAAAKKLAELPAVEKTVPSRVRRLRVLVADDHPLNLRLISRLLHLQDFEVSAVADGAAALAALQASYEPGAAPFDLAVLDMNMPALSGPEASSAFRVWECTTRPDAMRLPIIALTANVMEEHAAECASAGCVHA